ncbi:MAG: hypothetical protein DLM54_10800 [Acidimicrobiales bacterium]|nr:MAG: hypothetical protein DLM54_10800 [Acidimicrobiales bacterium]
MGGDGIAYDLVLVAHVLSAVVAVGAVLATGAYASVAGRPGALGGQGAVRRYFRPGTNWLSRVLYAVPILGMVLVVLGHGTGSLGELWLWLSTLLWVLAAALAQGVLWPAERTLQALLEASEGAPGEGPKGGDGGEATGGQGAGDRGSTSRQASLAAAGVDLCLLASFVLMVGRPGSG